MLADEHVHRPHASSTSLDAATTRGTTLVSTRVNDRPLGALPFFLDANDGQRFCMYYPRAADSSLRGNLVYVHPFAEEMNKSRRMVAMQARRAATRGWNVLTMDLAGCGDSSGEFRDARWETWMGDVTDAAAWMQVREPADLILWGLRLGATLAVEVSHALGARSLWLWQPVLNGEQFMTQFLRLRLASAMLAGEQGGGTQALREQAHTDGLLEVAGYELSAGLIAAIDQRVLSKMQAPTCEVHWFELVAEQGRELSPASSRLLQRWAEQGVSVSVHRVVGAAFWSTPEITDCPSLLERMDQLVGVAA